MPQHLPLPLLLLSFLFFPLTFLVHRHLTRSIPPQASPCKASTYLIGYAKTPQSLSHFLSQFPNSLPKDLCILFSAPFTYPSHSALFLISPTSLTNLALTAIRAGAQNIFVAHDAAYFHTVHYGIGKDDVSAKNSMSLRDILPHFTSVRLLSSQDPTQVLSRHSVFPRGTSIRDLATSGGLPSVNYSALPKVSTSSERHPVVYYVQDGADEEPLFRGVSRVMANPLSHILLPSKEERDVVKALTLEHGCLAPLPAAPVMYGQKAFWALAPFECRWQRGIYNDVVKGYVVQRVLQATGRGVLFVKGGVEVWDMEVGGQGNLEKIIMDNERVGRVVEKLKKMDAPRGMDADKLFLYFAKRLAADGLVEWCSVKNAEFFLRTVREMGIEDNSKAIVEDRVTMTENQQLPKTGVCVTGQMRSAPFTSASIRRALKTGVGGYEVLIVTEKDDRVGSSKLFGPEKVGYSKVHQVHDIWVSMLLNSSVVHETMSTERQLRNYLMQLADMKDCLNLVQKREMERGQRFENLVRLRPDTVLNGGVDLSWWAGSRVVVHGKRHAFYAMNDRFFAGDRTLMGRLLSCHDMFGLLVGKGVVYHRKAGDATHMLWKKMINSERFLARCAAFRRVPLQPVIEIDARRVAYSEGVARWREGEGPSI